MGWKDWLAGAVFALTVAAAVVTFVLVFHHERTHVSVISPARERSLQKLCYQNLGNGGC
jgi:hypothetical protein